MNAYRGDAEFQRFVLPPKFDHVVRHIWSVRWSLKAYEQRPQRILNYPTFNLVIEPERTALYRPRSRVQYKVLEGESWALGLLLRPSAAILFADRPWLISPDGSDIRTGVEDRLHRLLPIQAQSNQAQSTGIERVTAVLADWLDPLRHQVTEEMLLINELCRIAEEDSDVVRVRDLAARVHLSERSAQRLTRRYLGLSPKWLIECRRMHAASQTLTQHRHIRISELAADLGYTDAAHFARVYRQVIGESPGSTREAARSYTGRS